MLSCNSDAVLCLTGDKNEEELLKGLLTNDYCHVCEAVLLFESQRLSHYEVCAVSQNTSHVAAGYFTDLTGKTMPDTV